MALDKIQLASLPDDDPSLALEVPLDLIEPYASVMPVQFVGDDDGHLAVRERHAERLAAVVHFRPPDIRWTAGSDRTPDELFAHQSGLVPRVGIENAEQTLRARIVPGRAPFGLLRGLGLPCAFASPRAAGADRPPTHHSADQNGNLFPRLRLISKVLW